jgi:hypothetical protein
VGYQYNRNELETLATGNLHKGASPAASAVVLQRRHRQGAVRPAAARDLL